MRSSRTAIAQPTPGKCTTKGRLMSESTSTESRETNFPDIASEYDAFISYKHGPVDSAAARALQKNLEHFRMPIVAGRGPKRIRRVFLDEGELSATAAFSARIQQALKNARWLIIICSPATKNSPWVNLEIESFIKYHDRDHILAVMTSGEPVDIFPDAFIGSGNMPDEMLAADARGETAQEVVKKLRGDTLLRIAAPILGMTYDDLKQRHRTYQLRRFSIVASICLAAVSSFLIYAALQNRKLSRFNRNLTLTHSELVTEKAATQLSEGNNLQAVSSLLSVVRSFTAPGSTGQILNAGTSADDILPASQYQLTEALNLYRPYLTPNIQDQHIEVCALYNAPESLEADLLSDSDGTHLLAAGSRGVYVWDTKTDKLSIVIPIALDDSIRNWSPDALCDGDRIILCGSHSAVCYDYTTGDVVWKTMIVDQVCCVARFRSDSPARTDRLYLLSQSGLTVLDAESGSILSENRLTAASTSADPGTIAADPGDVSSADETIVLSIPQQPTISASGKYLLFTTEDSSQMYSLCACDLTTFEVALIDTAPNNRFEYNTVTTYIDPDTGTEHILYASTQYSDSQSICLLTSASLSGNTAAAADPLSEPAAPIARIDWQKEYPLNAQQLQNGTLTAHLKTVGGRVCFVPQFEREGQPPAIMCSCYSDLLLLDPASGEVLNKSPFASNIFKLVREPDCVSAYTTGGRLYLYNGEQTQLASSTFPFDCNDIEKLPGQFTFFCLFNQKEIRRYSPADPDGNYVLMAQANERPPASPVFRDREWTVLHDLSNLCWISETGDMFRSSAFSELDPDGAGKSAAPRFLAIEDGSLLYVDAFYDETSGTVVSSYRLNMADGNVTKEELFRTDIYIYPLEGSFLYDPNRRILYFMASGEDVTILWAYDMETKKAVRHALPLGLSCLFYRLSPDGSKILLTSDMDLLVLDTSTWKTDYTISLADYAPSSLSYLSRATDNGLIAWDGRTLVVPEHLALHVYDASGRETHTIALAEDLSDHFGNMVPCAALSPDGNCLYYIYGSSLTQYSLPDAKILNEATLESVSSSTHSYSDVWDYSFASVTDSPAAGGSRYGLSSLKGRKKDAPDTLRVLYGNDFYCVSCDPDAFGVKTHVPGTLAFNPFTGQIYTTLLAITPTGTAYNVLRYKEYSIDDIVRIAEERYNSVDGIPAPADSR